MTTASPDGALQNVRVLIVEDEALVAMLLEDMLQDLGCVMAGTASTVDQGVEAASGLEIDVAILDMNLAGKPVLPVAEALAGRGKPFIFATGYGESGVPDAWRDRPTLQKPFSMVDVETALKKAVASA
jgi:CheY-like chemotaxis protein